MPHEVCASFFIMLSLGAVEFFRFDMWGTHEALESKIMPRILTVGCSWIIWSPILMNTFCVFLLGLKIRRLVLVGEKRKPDTLDQDISLFVAFCNNFWIKSEQELRQRMVKSSAYSKGMQGFSIPSAMSLIAIRNRVTDIVEPCGTPFSWLNMSDRVLEVLT